jgi:hypothetical protein
LVMRPGSAAQTRALLEDIGDFLAAILDRVLPTPAFSLRLISLLQQMSHDPPKLRAEGAVIALGQALQLLDQVREIERRHVARAQRRHLLLDPESEILVVERPRGLLERHGVLPSSSASICSRVILG